MDGDLKWVAGIAVTTFGTVIGAVWVMLRALAAKVSNGDGVLHAKIDDVKEKYVRRDDFERHLDRIEDNIHEIRDEARDGKREVLAAIAEIHRNG